MLFSLSNCFPYEILIYYVFFNIFSLHFSNFVFLISVTSFNIAYVGFETSKVACCGQGPYNGLGLCTPFSNLCSDRNKYVFWDPFHPSERANRLIVQVMMNSTTKYMNPMNLSTIKTLDSKV